jgi:serpin B
MGRNPWVTGLILALVLAAVAAPLEAARAKQKAPASSAPVKDTDPDKAAIAQAVNQFTFDLYARLAAGKGNLFCSPQSISTALMMTWAGARTETAAEMAKVLRLPADRLAMPESIHAANAKLLAGLSGTREKQGYELAVANALWGQRGCKWVPDFLSLLKTGYGAGLEEVDFAGDTEGARKIINAWVEKQTRDKIKDLIQQGVLNNMTRLVLTNAIYFKGDWAEQFKKDETKDEDFFPAGGAKASAPMMHQKKRFNYFDGGDFQVLEMPYKGNALSMVVLLPKAKDGLAALEKSLSSEKVSEWLAKLQNQEVRVAIPRFKTTAEFSLKDVLVAMGMPLAFSEGKADFSGMNGAKDLFIGAVIHKAFVDVNEEGTEAAAATAVKIEVTAMPAPPVEFRADHPFLYLIRDTRTGCILFIGRVANPKE